MKNIIILSTLIFFVACETGVKATEEEKASHNKIKDLIERPISAEALVEKRFIDLDDMENEELYDVEDNPKREEAYIDASQDFKGGVRSDGLNVKSIRVGKHDGYVRLVFDVDSHGAVVKEVGNYSVRYLEETNIILVTIEGYRSFSAKFPKFSRQSSIEKIYFNEYLDDSGYQFSIKLRDRVKVKAYDYKTPARLIIDITPLV